MAKKIKKFSRNINSPRRGGEKIRRASRQFTVAVALYIVLVILATLLGYTGKFDLSGPSANGFAICYLVIPAYIPMLILDGAAGLFGCSLNVACGREILLYSICDIFIALNVWWLVNLTARRKQSVSLLRSAKKLIWIIVCWGIFQLCCTLISFAWQKSSFKSWHLHSQNQTFGDQQ